MTPRLASGVLVTALIRRVEASGGHGIVLAKGDATSGAVVLVLADRGVPSRLVERAQDIDGRYAWAATGPKALDEPGALSDYITRRRRSDPDLWVVELDAPDAGAIATEVLG